MKKWHLIIGVLVLIWLISFITAQVTEQGEIKTSSKVALIPIKGFIDGGNLLLEGESVSSDFVIESIDKANSDESIEAILFEINSPGGAVVATEELVRAVDKVNKPNVAWIRDVGASGAYWISTASDKIVADPLSITGSVGVIGSYLEFSKLMEKYGITYQQLTSGEYKDLGSPYKELSEKEKEILQYKINKIHQIFLDDVAKRRNLTSSQMSRISTAEFYLGLEAKELGLVDELGGKEKAIEVLKEIGGLEDVTLVSYKRKVSFFDILRSLSAYNSFYIGKGIGSEIKFKEEFKIIA